MAPVGTVTSVTVVITAPPSSLQVHCSWEGAQGTLRGWMEQNAEQQQQHTPGEH